MDKLSIGELAKRANVNIETIRYYERRGLLSIPSRNKSGHRQYSTDEIRRTDFIKRCQALGFSLKEIAEILELRITPESTCGDMQSRVTEKLIDVDKKIKELGQIRNALNRLIKKCTGKGPISKCPILEELYQ
jgi:MerR family mercuric resistance operon transcriptional regulator